MRKRLLGALVLAAVLLAGARPLVAQATWPGRTDLGHLVHARSITVNSEGAGAKAGPPARHLLEAQATVDPLYGGGFAEPGGTAGHLITIENDGGSSETYNLTAVSIWPVEFYATEDGTATTPLTDTDSDGEVDTGSVPSGESVTVMAVVTAPPDAAVGDADEAEVTVSSDAPFTETVLLRTAIPAAFAQVFRDTDDDAMSIYLADPGGGLLSKATADGYEGDEMAVAETPSGFVYAWTKDRVASAGVVREIEAALLDGAGNVIFGPTKLTDHSGASESTRDHNPAVAVTSNGRVGVLWNREIVYGSDDHNYNVFFAILSTSGVFGPVNLTNNTARGPSTEVVRYNATSIAATGDNRFALAWERAEGAGGERIVDAYYAVRDDSGATVKGLTRYLSSEPGRYYYSPTPTAVGRKRWLMAYSGPNGISYAVLDSDGDILTGEQVAAQWDFGNDPDAVQLSDGKVLLAWTSAQVSPRRIGFAILSGPSYGTVTGPELRGDLPASSGDAAVSVAAERNGLGILAWTDASAGSRRNLYYSLVDSSGGVLTDPMIFYSSRAATPLLETAYRGYGIASYEIAVEGQVANNRGEPVFNADVGSAGAMVPATTTDGRGEYQLDFEGSGSYTVTASADGFGTLPPRYDLDVRGSVSGVDFVLPPEDDVVVNGGWESGSLSGWHTGPNVAPEVEEDVGHTGHYGLHLHATGGTLAFWPYVTQTVTISDTWVRPTLSFMYQVDEGDGVDDALLATVSNGGEVVTRTVTLVPGGWAHAWQDLSAFAGETVALKFGFREQTGGQRVYVDEISVGDARVGVYPLYLPLIARNF